MAMPSRTSRYSGRDRPACRMNQTGVRHRPLPAGSADEVGGAAGTIGHNPRSFHAGPISAS